jgi:hypothetical protein
MKNLAKFIQQHFFLIVENFLKIESRPFIIRNRIADNRGDVIDFLKRESFLL